MTLHAQVIRREGKKEFVVLPYEEYRRLRELLEDYEDLKELRRAKAMEGHLPGEPLNGVMKRLSLTGRPRRRSKRSPVR